MTVPTLNYIHTGAMGGLGDTTVDEVDRLARLAAQARHVVLHFHGGLVPKADGIETARRLAQSAYVGDGVLPIFFVWDSGFLTALRTGFFRIAADLIYRTVRDKVLGYAWGSVTNPGHARGGAGIRPLDKIGIQEVHEALAAGQEPLADVAGVGPLDDLSPQQEAEFAALVDADGQLQAALAAALGVSGAVPGARAAALSPGVADNESVLSEAARRRIRQRSGLPPTGDVPDGARSAALTLKIGWLAAKVLWRTIRRFRTGHDHGLYPTVVEEVCREFYLDTFGAGVWTEMKDMTAHAFDHAVPPPPERGGLQFLRRLAAALKGGGGHRPRLTLVGHSTGAVFINNLLACVERMRADPHDPFPADLTFRRVVFLAPACTFEHFLPTITARRGLFEDFRLYNMTDQAESRDVLVRGVYTRSLLYLVSGLLERTDADDPTASAEDMPLVGLERCWKREDVYRSPAVVAARQAMAGAAGGAWATWSPCAGVCGSTTHGDFDNDPHMLATLRSMM